MRPYTARRPYWGQGPVSCAASAALSNPTFRLAFSAVFHDHVCARGFFWCRAFYRTSDDKLFYFTLQAVNDWPVLCETIDRPELATDPRAHAHRPP